METVCSVTGLVLLALALSQLILSFVFAARYRAITDEGKALLTMAGGSHLCSENELNLAFASNGGLDIIYMYCQYWI